MLTRMGWNEVYAASIAAGGPILVREVARIAAVQERAIRGRAQREGWWHPYPSVVAVPGTPRDGRARALAAALHARGRTGDPGRDVAAVTRDSALAVLGILRTYPTMTTVVVPSARSLAPRARLDVVRSAWLRPDDVTEHQGVPVVTGTALVRHLAPVRDRSALRRVLIDLAHGGFVHLASVANDLDEMSRFPGAPTARGAIADLLSAGRTDSPLELDVRDGLHREHIPLDRGQVHVPGTRIHLDLGIAAIRFGIEADSFGHHGSRAELDRDARRVNAVAATGQGWEVLHATWSTLEPARWSRFVRQVRDVITEQSLRHLAWACPGRRRMRSVEPVWWVADTIDPIGEVEVPARRRSTSTIATAPRGSASAPPRFRVGLGGGSASRSVGPRSP